MKKITLAILLLFPVVGLANCPDINNVTYQCSANVSGQKYCQWTAPWWDGYQAEEGEPGDHPVDFFMAFWGSGGDPEQGSINCFYKDKNNHLVQLSQNSWGGIPKPTTIYWRDGAWPGTDNAKMGKICDTSTAVCSFNYG